MDAVSVANRKLLDLLPSGKISGTHELELFGRQCNELVHCKGSVVRLDAEWILSSPGSINQLVRLRARHCWPTRPPSQLQWRGPRGVDDACLRRSIHFRVSDIGIKHIAEGGHGADRKPGVQETTPDVGRALGSSPWRGNSRRVEYRKVRSSSRRDTLHSRVLSLTV